MNLKKGIKKRTKSNGKRQKEGRKMCGQQKKKKKTTKWKWAQGKMVSLGRIFFPSVFSQVFFPNLRDCILVGLGACPLIFLSIFLSYQIHQHAIFFPLFSPPLSILSKLTPTKRCQKKKGNQILSHNLRLGRSDAQWLFFFVSSWTLWK